MLFILRSGDKEPYDYYVGGSHFLRGEKQPNETPILQEAKKYHTEQAAINAMNRINKYTPDFVFYILEYTKYNN